ncbi:MAG: LPS export ABC transporter ATP-binding protein [Xanthobacteraceae bacterium]|nr:LPS export ABC transporter ATP-binding protein [Xanthobacteraceae bacterium]
MKVPWFRSGNKDKRDKPALADQWRLDAPERQRAAPARQAPERPPQQQPAPREQRQQAPQPRPAAEARPHPLQQELPRGARPAQTWRPPAEDLREPPRAPSPQPRSNGFNLEGRLRSAAEDERPSRPRAHPPHIPVPREGVLAADGLQKSYGGRRVVNDVSIDVMRGEAVGILGPNGAGKTTCFYMVTGLVEPDAGHISLDGHDVTKLPMYRRARLGIGYLPQEASIFRGLNVENNLLAVLEVVEPDKRRRMQRLEELLDEFSIQHIRKSPSIALSGGERRRVEIARALATNPHYMLLDEPFAGIDPIAVGDIRALVRHLTGRGIGVLITDHNVRETLGLVDRAYIIHSGSVLMEGTPEEIVESDEVRRLYLGEEFRL